jgi:putative pyruvate formate lyase activating enzyme
MNDTEFVPAYERTDPDAVRARAAALREMMRSCSLCPRRCGVDRLAGERGVCGVGEEPVVSSYGPHFGEERPLVGRHGSGTIFLTHCNLKCIFCQNYDISHLGSGRQVTVDDVADMMLRLQSQGCHNVNWVTPTHQAPMLVEALLIARGCPAREACPTERGRGLRVPVVYNCGGYESVEALRLLEGIVDIYMPDAKYGDNEIGRRLSAVPDYWDRNREALAEMHRQVGDLRMDEVPRPGGRDGGPAKPGLATGIAQRGMLVRHLVLPENLARTQAVMEYLASLSRDTYVNVMAQYRPQYRAGEAPELRRSITTAEYRAAVDAALKAGLHRLDERWGF